MNEIYASDGEKQYAITKRLKVDKPYPTITYGAFPRVVPPKTARIIPRTIFSQFRNNPLV